MEQRQPFLGAETGAVLTVRGHFGFPVPSHIPVPGYVHSYCLCHSPVLKSSKSSDKNITDPFPDLSGNQEVI